MSKHIFWISSYPKSGNTLVRAIISTLFFSKDGNFLLSQLKHSSQFEKRDRLNLIKKINKEDFLNDFEILSVLRNMKIIGIFTRLAVRDNKKKYLNLIPYAWKLIELRMRRNARFGELKNIFDTNFSKKKRSFK